MAVCHCEFSLLPLGPCLFLAAASTASDAGATCASSAGRTTAGGGSGMPSALNGQAAVLAGAAAVLAGAAAGACASAGAGVSTGAGAGATALAGAAALTGGLALAGAFALAGGGATTRAATHPAFEGATGRAAGGTAGKTTPAFEAEEQGLSLRTCCHCELFSLYWLPIFARLGSGTVAGFGGRVLAAVAQLGVERQGGTGSCGGVLGASSSGHLGAGASGGLGAGATAASGV